LLAVRGDDARDGGFTDAVEPRHLGTGLAAGRDGLGDFAALLVAELGPTPADPSFCASLARPALVRSRIMARSNSAKLPTICIIIRPAAVVVSIASVSERKPAPASSIRSMMCSISFRLRDSRSSFQTTTTSPSRNWPIISRSLGRSHRPPLAVSSNTRLQPAASSARRAAFDWSSPFDTRA
jgi:hypothetical protein